MKFYVNRLPVRGPWGGGAHAIRAMYEFVPKLNHVVCNPADFKASPDVFLMFGLDADNDCISLEQAITFKMYMKPDSKIVIRVNECDARKGTKGVDDAWINASRFVDGAIFVSDWLRDYFLERGWHCKNNVVIYNGVNKEIFKPSEKLNDGKIHIVSAHWSDNPLKGQDVTEWLDDFVGKHPEYAFTFVGRTKAKLTNGSVVGPLSGKKLGEELAKHHVCVNGSRFDPGPNSVIEPIACGLPTYVHKDGGGGVEFAGKSHVFNDVFSLEKLLLTNQFQQNLTSFDDWEIVVKRYVDFVVNLSV